MKKPPLPDVTETARYRGSTLLDASQIEQAPASAPDNGGDPSGISSRVQQGAFKKPFPRNRSQLMSFLKAQGGALWQGVLSYFFLAEKLLQILFVYILWQKTPTAQAISRFGLPLFLFRASTGTC
jgi:hypothetical protein